jgi:ferredoxin-NADP reductase
MPVAAATRRLLASPLIDLLVGPHGIDRYLELIRPDLTVHDARAEIVAVDRQTARSVTLRLRPNRAWRGHRAGQFVRVGLEIGGVRRTRTYSPASSEHGAPGGLELTVTVHPHGLVSRHVNARVTPGTIVHLGEPEGGFVLPDPRPERVALISGGSGVTPVLSMLRTLCDENHDGEVVFVHYARTPADWLYRGEVEALAARYRNVRAVFAATREPAAGRRAGRMSPDVLRELLVDPAGATAAVCGPPSLIAAVRAAWETLGGAPRAVLAETFAPPIAPHAAGNACAGGTLSFLSSRRSAEIGHGTLLEQAEAAGLRPEFGCRMGICRTCTCHKATGTVRNVLTGELSGEENEDIQLCVSVPEGDVALEL